MKRLKLIFSKWYYFSKKIIEKLDIVLRDSKAMLTSKIQLNHINNKICIEMCGFYPFENKKTGRFKFH